MSLVIHEETTEYLYVGVTGQPPTQGAEVAFMAPGVRPETSDWKTAIVIDNEQHDLWEDASTSGLFGDYYVGRLVGSFGSNDVVLPIGDYQPWLRLTGEDERPVRISPIALEVV